MKRWVGRSFVLVGIIHCVVGLVIFFDPLTGIVRDGVWNAVDDYSGRPLASWFEFVGMFTILFGATIDWIEKEFGKFPVFLGFGFLGLNIVGIVTMPIGGGWLLLPGAIGLLMKMDRTAKNVTEAV